MLVAAQKNEKPVSRNDSRNENEEDVCIYIKGDHGPSRRGGACARVAT